MIVLLYSASSAILTAGFANVERQEMIKNVQRASDALLVDVTELNVTAGNWANWDETYAFIEDHNENYVKSYLYDDEFKLIKVNLIIIVDSRGDIVFSKSLDLQNMTKIAISSGDIVQNISRYQGSEKSISGLIILPQGPMLIAVHPVLTSEGKGPSRGTLIMGEFVDEMEIQHLAATTHLSLETHLFESQAMPPDFQEARDSLSKDDKILVRPLGEEAIAGYTLLSDIYGKPALMLHVDTPRDIFNQGKASMLYLFISLIALGLIFGVLTIWLLEKLVLFRLERLNSDVTGIGTIKELSVRVAIKGRDELSSLAESINRMLEALERSQFERQEVEKELRAHRDQLAYVSRAKSEFLATMSHELRTPLNSIIGFSELLKGGMYGELNEKQAHYIDNVITSSKFLLNLINDILDLSKVEAGKIELVIEKMPVPGTISETIILINEEASMHNINIEQDFDPQLDFIEADKQRFKQILFNLLTNAIKFSKKEGGTITITTKKERDMAKFSVSDTGIGIKEEDMGKLFKEFVQASPGISKEYGGTGLGLVISKKLAELHGGSFSVESRYGEGSTFTFTLPIKAKESGN